MMESFEVDCGGRRCRESFETDEFYESIEAPKFYDFTAPEEPIDPEAWFNGNPGGMTKKVTEVLRAVHNPKIQKEVDSKTKDGHGGSSPGSLHQSHCKSPVAEMAVSAAAGGAKSHQGSITVSVSPLLTSKSSRNGTNMHNGPSNHPILVEKFSELALKSTSVMKKTWQPSENDDPNPVTSMARHSPVVTPSQPGKHSRRPPPAAVLLGHLPVSCTTDMKCAEAALPSSQPQTTAVVAGGRVVLGDGGSSILVDGKLVDQSFAKSSPLKKEIPSKGAGITVVKAQRSNHGEARSSPAALLRSAPQEHSTLGTGATCKTPIKEPASSEVLEDCSEHKKITAGNELTASPYSGHHCRSSRCAANDPNYNSPASIPKKKYLMARQGTPGCRALFGSVRANPEYQEAGKVQNHLQQMKYPSDINMSKDRVPNNDNLEEVLVAAAYPQCDQKEMDLQKTLDIEKLQLSKESEQPLSEHIVQVEKDAADPLCDQKDMGVQKTLDLLQQLQEELPKECKQPLSEIVVQDSHEGCNPTDIHHALVQEENSKASVRPLSEHLVEDLQENSNPEDMQLVKVQEGISKESRMPISEHFIQDTQERCNPLEVTTDLHLGNGQEVHSVKDSNSEEVTFTEALVMGNVEGASTGALFDVNDKDTPSSLEEHLSIEGVATRPSSEVVENQRVMIEKGKAEQHPMVPFLFQSGRKRKSQGLEFEVSIKKANCFHQVSSQHTKSHTKEALSGCKTKPRKKSTNPRPFRLRTQERGVLKEIEFNKKMEEYLAAREGFLSAFQGLSVLEPRVVGKPPRQVAKDPSMQPRHHVFSAKRADPAEKVPEDDGAMKNDKQTIIHAQKMPTFDHPFKPHRSTKKLTVPQEFKFHPMNGTRTCPLHSQ